MTIRFDPDRGLVVVSAEIAGPAGTAVIRLALDTGATSTLINAGILVALGYDPASAAKRIEITTGSGVDYVPRVLLRRIKVLGATHSKVEVLSHTLPPSASVDGLLGLDFLRDRTVTIDFKNGRLDNK